MGRRFKIQNFPKFEPVKFLSQENFGKNWVILLKIWPKLKQIGI